MAGGNLLIVAVHRRDDDRMKWPDVLLKPTREYTGGTLSGLGLGVLVSEMVVRRSGEPIPWTAAFVVGFALIAIGSALARAGQRNKSVS